MNFITWEGMKEGQILAVDELGNVCTESQLRTHANRLKENLRNAKLVFLFCRNDRLSLMNYLSLLHLGCVPLLLEQQMPEEFKKQLIERYQPDALIEGNTILYDTKTGPEQNHRMGDDLALLLSTSGSTGSPKLVRLSQRNLMSNAQSIVTYLQINQHERPITSLPMHYTYGLSVIHSHLLRDAVILLSERSVMEQEFWNMVRNQKATSLAGVPYTYQMLERIGFLQWDLPSLTTLTQAGGKLPEERQKKFAEYCKSKDKKFVVMYGQTEATARMAYLPYERSFDKIGSMGVPIPGGSFTLEDEEGNLILLPEQTGELIYRGPNVALGYAVQRSDLDKGNEWKGVLRTGDLARRDLDGFYYIVGRKKRFLKIYGKRVSLDQVEKKIWEHFGIAAACCGQDDVLQVWYEEERTEDDAQLEEKISDFLCDSLRIGRSAQHITKIEKIPRNSAGKILYSEFSKGISLDKTTENR